MPRITADTVAEHARLQRAAVLDAAVRLFTQFGVDKVSLGDIAAEVGLARNSIYRYFPDRNRLIAAWFDHEIEPLAVACQKILENGLTPLEQLDGWVDLHMSYLRMPGHREMITAVAATPDLSEGTLTHITEGHQQVYGPLKKILCSLRSDLANRTADLDLLASLVAAMVRTGSSVVPGDDASAQGLERSLMSAINSVVVGFEPDPGQVSSEAGAEN